MDEELQELEPEQTREQELGQCPETLLYLEPEDGRRPAPESETLEDVDKEQVQEPEISSDDPFAGTETEDINNYADLFDTPPPENDNEAKKLAEKIRKWISDGRPE